MRIQCVLALVLLLGGGTDSYDDVDEEDNYYKYREEYDMTTTTPQEQKRQHLQHAATTATRTLSDEEISYVEDALKQLLLGRKIEEIIPTWTQTWPETTTSWYTVKNIFAKILKDVEGMENNKGDIMCSGSIHSTLSEFGVNQDECDADIACKDNKKQCTRSNCEITQNWIRTDSVPAQEMFRNQLKGTTEGEHLHTLEMNCPEIENAFEFNRSYIQYAIEKFINKERVKRDPLYETTTSDGREYRRRKVKPTTKARRQRRKSTTATTEPVNLDLAKLMELISNLTEVYSQNLTQKIRAELETAGLPTCPTDTNSTETPASAITNTEDPYGNLTGTIMGKCFVCGLDEPDMPRYPACADAFAGDMIPLVQVDALAKKHLSEFRKYCRWMNIPKYIINETDPRSMWGRWTGGCSVRWADISGIYTQRTCRNRHRAVTGKHWASKRMAKLEMALQRTDNDCIISPMATLVPLSRGISIYARFHACVCTGSWCNGATSSRQCTSCVGVLVAISVMVMVLRIFLLECSMRLENVSRRKCMLFTAYY